MTQIRWKGSLSQRQGTGILHSVKVSWLLRFGSFVNILFIINIQTGSTGWTYITLFFFFFYLSQLSCLQRVQMEIETRDTQRWPLEALYPHPPPWTRALPWQTDQFSALCLLWGGYNTHNPSSHLPLPSCSGWCPNASTSHLGLPKPVLTVGGAAWRALTLDGNTVVQGLAGWLAEVQIILLIMHSGKQLPRTKGIQQTGNGPTFPTTAWHASSVIST